MGRNLLDNPLMQNAEMIALAPRVVPLGISTWTQIVQPQVMRLTLTIMALDMNQPVFISPLPYGANGLSAFANRYGVIQIHGAEFPLLIGGPWYCFCPAAQSVTVIDTIRITG